MCQSPSFDLRPERLEGMQAARQRVVGEIALDHGAEPRSLGWKRQMPTSLQLGLHLVQLVPYPLAHRPALQQESPRPGPRADVRGAQEVEGSRPALAAFPSALVRARSTSFPGLLSRGFKSEGRPSFPPESYRGGRLPPRAGRPPAGQVHLHGARTLEHIVRPSQNPQCLWPVRSARAGNRTRTTLASQRILSPLRLPVPPLVRQ